MVSIGATDIDQTSATVLALSCTAAALLAWPVRGPAIARPGDRDGVRKSSKDRPGGSRIPSARATVPLAAAAATLVGATTGLAVGLAVGIAVLTAGRLAGSMLTGVRHRRELDELSTGLRLLGRELRNGAAPQAACAAAAPAAKGSASTVLLRVAAEAIRTNRADLAGRAGPPPSSDRCGPAAEVDLRLRQGLVLADSYGVPWADVVTAVASDVEETARAEAARATEAAGPRLSGYVLAALPALGVLLGIGMGADPMAVLFGSAPGNLLLLTGTGLTCAGLMWSARIAAG